MEHDRIINFLNSCTYLSCVGGFLSALFGWVGINGQAIAVFIALFTFLMALHFNHKKDSREQIEFEARMKIYASKNGEIEDV